jgi:hypothetical protein
MSIPTRFISSEWLYSSVFILFGYSATPWRLCAYDHDSSKRLKPEEQDLKLHQN